jgi:hypothetical protein
MVASRKFTYRERLMEPCPFADEDEWTGICVWQHKLVSGGR